MKSIIKIATISSVGLLSALGFSTFHNQFSRGKWVTPQTSMNNSVGYTDSSSDTSRPTIWMDKEIIYQNAFSRLTSTKDSSKTPRVNPKILNKKFKDSSKIIYLLDASNNIEDCAQSDAFGHVNFNIDKPGVYRIAVMNGSQVLWSKRALLNVGSNDLKLPADPFTYENNHLGIAAPLRKDGSRMYLDMAVGASPKTLEKRAPSRDLMEAPALMHSEISHATSEAEAIEEIAVEYDEMAKPDPISPDSRTKDRVSPPRDKAKTIEKGKAGVMTAGLWNDLENWDRFHKTLQEEKMHADQWNWKMDNRRYAVEITDKNGKPAMDISLQLRNGSGSIFWSAKTDNRGFAELWYAPFKPALGDLPHDFYLYAQYGERGYTELGKVGSNGDVRNAFRINFEANTPKNVDICFVVDATGSMGDEINYLKEELMELMLRSSEMVPCSELRLATVFYRDVYDAYTAIHAPFTSRFEDAVDFVHKQGASGGGDYPEAVDAGLNESIEKLEWSSKALARLCFLVLDAPPHQEKKSEIERLTQEYAAKGIKIIPIVASGVDKPTEFLMKRMAAITAGDYVYITDHSGVGNSHIKPSGVKSDVDLLKNQLEKIIRKYTENKDCEKDAQPYNPDPNTVIFGDDQIIIQSFPNPATSFINIHSNTTINSLEVYALNGQVVKRIENIGSDRYRLDVRAIDKGMYVLRVNTQNQQYSAKILILSSQGID